MADETKHFVDGKNLLVMCCIVSLFTQLPETAVNVLEEQVNAAFVNIWQHT